MILGLVKTALIDDEVLLNQVIRRYGQIQPNQEYEYNLSSDALTLRLISYDPEQLKAGKFSETDRKIVHKISNWGEIKKILGRYNLDTSFEDLLQQIKTKASDRSKKRIVGVFKSMITTKSGEQGTPKGDNKELARKKVDSILA